MGDDNEICEGLTSNSYVCMNRTTSNYTINTELQSIKDLQLGESINFNEDKTQLTLTATTSNHYFIADEKAHCSEKWQDWFCVPNYHNNNKMNKYPETDTMSVGVCFNSCPIGYIPSKINKCILYNVEDDLLYNPLAIIALIGTNLYMDKSNKIKIANYKDIKDTIGIRGSYLNDLYRVNYNNRFIPYDRIDYINNLPDITKPYDITKQEKIIIDIIKEFVSKGRTDGRTDDNGMCLAIRLIKVDMIKATKEFVEQYINQLSFSKVKQNMLLGKIKDYVINIEKLDKIFGLDKSGRSKFKNAISYAYNIMRVVFYESKDGGKTYELSKNVDIDDKIRELIEINNIIKKDDKGYEKKENSLIKIFKFACYNCFNVNYDVIKEYLDEKYGQDSDNIMRRYKNDKDKDVKGNIEKGEDEYEKGFIKCDIDVEQLESVTSNRIFYNIPYYNNIIFCEHQLLSEYSENTKSIIQIILILAIFLGIIVVIWLIYGIILYFPLFNKRKGDFISAIVSFLNYCSLFYNFITYYLVCTISYFYFYILCKYCNSNYTILNIFLKLLNIVIIIALVICTFIIILEMLNINYIRLLQNMDFGIGNQVLEGSDIDTNSFIYIYLAALYFIGIYMYSIYIVRYGISSKEFEMITNKDAKEINSTDYINNLLLNKYVDNMLSKFNAVYDGDQKDTADEGDSGADGDVDSGEVDSGEVDSGEVDSGAADTSVAPAPPVSVEKKRMRVINPIPQGALSMSAPPSFTSGDTSVVPTTPSGSVGNRVGRGVYEQAPSGALSMMLTPPTLTPSGSVGNRVGRGEGVFEQIPSNWLTGRTSP